MLEAYKAMMWEGLLLGQQGAMTVNTGCVGGTWPDMWVWEGETQTCPEVWLQQLGDSGVIY